MSSSGANPRLRSRLLAGVAALAVAAPAAGKAVAQEAKWQPWLEAGGAIGSHSFGDVDMFIPVWQDQTSLLFGDLRGTFTAAPTQEGNFGLGYRTQVDSDWILGGYGFIDIQNSKYDNLFYQGSVGLEALSVDWDLRLNGYFPFNSGGKSTGDNTGHIEISGNNIGMTHDLEKSLFGFDGEVGWRLPIFPANGDLDVRAFVGGYYFANSDVDTIAGPRGRLEVRLYDLDVLGVQSRLTLDGEIQWDSPRGTQGFGGLELRIPLGVVTGTPGPKLSPLDRRMVDRVQRDVDIVTEKYQSDPSDVVVDGLTVKTHTIVFAEEGGTGNGTKGNPASLEDAPAVAASHGANAIIVVEGDGGQINLTGQPVQLADGQALLGGQSVVRLTDAKDSGIHANFHAPGQRPTIVGSTSTANLIQMYSGGQNRVTGLDLEGTFANAIFGSNMARAIVTDNFIDPPASNGIFLQNSGAAIPTSQLAYIARNTIEGARSAGIGVHSYLFDAVAHTQTVVILDNTVTGGGVGIAETVNGSGQPGFVESVLIAGNDIEGASSHGIVAFNSFLSMTGGFTAAVTIYRNRVGDVGGNGIESVDSFLGVPGTAVETQIIAGNEISGTGQDGITGIISGVSLGALSQTAIIASNSIASVSGAGIKMVLADGFVAGPLDSVLSVTYNRVTSAGGRGIDLFVEQFSAPAISQAVAVSRNSIASVGGDGVSLFETLNQAGDVASTVSIYANSVSSAAANGIALQFQDGQISGGFAQTATIGRNTVAGAVSSGISALTELAQIDGPASDSLLVAGNSVTGAGAAGIALQESAAAATLTRSLAVYGNSIAGASAFGLVVGFGGESLGGLSEAVAIAGNALTSDGSGILLLDRLATVSGASIEDISVTGNSIAALTSNAPITLVLNRLYLTGVSEHVDISGNTLSSVPPAVPGILITENLVVTSAATLRDVSILGNTMTGGLGAAGVIDILALGRASGGVTDSLVIADNTIGAPLGGVFVMHNWTGSGPASASVLVQGNEIEGASGAAGGLVQLMFDSFSALSQSIVVGGNAVTAAPGGGGIQVVDSLGTIPGPVVTSLSIYGNHFQGGGGVTVNFGANNLQSLTQTIAITGNSIVDAGQAGILVATALNTVSDPATLSLLVSGNSVISPQLSGIYLAQALVAGSASQALTIAGNTVTDAGSQGIIDSIAAAGSFAQTGAIDGNLVTRAGGNGIRISAGGGGTNTIGLSLAGNSVSGNGKNGFAGLASGAGVTETFTLVSGSGNHFTGNGGAGAYLSNLGGSLTFHINGNDLAGNTGGTTATAGTVTISP
jgi:hypothetical protein